MGIEFSIKGSDNITFLDLSERIASLTGQITINLQNGNQGTVITKVAPTTGDDKVWFLLENPNTKSKVNTGFRTIRYPKSNVLLTNRAKLAKETDNIFYKFLSQLQDGFWYIIYTDERLPSQVYDGPVVINYGVY